MSEKTEKTLTREEMLEACRMYKKEWRKKNPEKQKEYTARYIQKKAMQIVEQMQGDRTHE